MGELFQGSLSIFLAKSTLFVNFSKKTPQGVIGTIFVKITHLSISSPRRHISHSFLDILHISNKKETRRPFLQGVTNPINQDPQGPPPALEDPRARVFFSKITIISYNFIITISDRREEIVI